MISVWSFAGFGEFDFVSRADHVNNVHMGLTHVNVSYLVQKTTEPYKGHASYRLVKMSKCPNVELLYGDVEMSRCRDVEMSKC